MSDKVEVKVSSKDIQSVNQKLETFVKGLPAGEQNVMAWLLGRAAQAPVEGTELVERPTRERGAVEPAAAASTRLSGTELSAREPLVQALGISQFERLQPGSRFAGSSVGVTGTIMF